MTATGTFDGVDFEIDADPLGAEWDSQVSDRPIPGGNITYRDHGGQLPGRFNYSIYCSTAAAFASLVAKRGLSGTLTTAIDGTITATLKSLRRTKVWPGGATEGTVEFWEA